METVVRRIQHGRDPTDRLAALARQEELDLRVLEKRILVRIEEGFALKNKRRDPEVITPIDTPRQLDKCLSIVRC